MSGLTTAVVIVGTAVAGLAFLVGLTELLIRRKERREFGWPVMAKRDRSEDLKNVLRHHPQLLRDEAFMREHHPDEWARR